MKFVAYALIVLCGVHGVLSGSHIVSVESRTGYARFNEDGVYAQFHPPKQVFRFVLGWALAIGSIALLVKDRYASISVFLLNIVAYVDGLNRANNATGGIDSIGLAAIISTFFVHVWFLPQLLFFVVLLVVTWRYRWSPARTVRAIRESAWETPPEKRVEVNDRGHR